MRTVVRTICATVLIPALAPAQRALTLSAPDAEYPEPFSVIAGARALRDGRLIVSDSREKTIQLITFGGTARRIGREGTGPNEWLNPGPIAALPGDSSAVWDAGNRRFFIVRPDGTPGGAMTPEKTSYGPFGSMLPRGSDARGNIYFQGSPFVQLPTGPAPADSVPVMRYDRSRDVADTVAYMHPPAGNATAIDGSISNGRANPLTPQDDWVVFPNGRVAVVRGLDYHIDFYENRVVKASGPRATWERVPVDAAVKKEILEQRRRQLTNASPRTAPTGQVSSIPAGALARYLNIEPWPATLPPFMRWAAIVRTASATPQVWVLRAGVKDAEPSRYDVFDDAGKLIARVQLPPRTTVVGFGPQLVYVIRTDDDDLQYLQRYRLPAF